MGKNIFSWYSTSDTNFQGLFGIRLDGTYSVWKLWKIPERANKSFLLCQNTAKECFVMLLLLSLATSLLHIRQDLTHAGSSALCFTPVSMLRERGDMFHIRALSDHVLDGQEYKIWGHVITLIGRFSEKLYYSAAFRESREKQHEREHGVRLPWSLSTSVHFHCFMEVCFEISLTHQTYLTALKESNL